MKFAVFTDPHLFTYKFKLDNFILFLKEMEDQVDGYICSGDWTSMGVDELEVIFQTCRSVTQKPILTVMGNHELWCHKNKYSLDEIFEIHSDLSKKYKITLLDEETFETEKSLICGYMGWYSVNNPGNTKDYDHIPTRNSMGLPAYNFLKKRELDGLYRVIDLETTKQKVCVTHFAFSKLEQRQQYCASYRNKEVLSEHCKIVITGHSHKKEDQEENGCHFYNAGAEYEDSPINHYFILDL